MSSSVIVLSHSIPSMMFREARISAAIASSLTAMAFAPGVLKTTIPASAQRSRGILLTPAPARAIAYSDGPYV